MPSRRFRNSRGAWVTVHEKFESLTQSRPRNLDSLNKEFSELLDTMQSPKARKAMKAAFTASPSELGHSAVKAVTQPV
jgi:antitoxin Phd